MWLTGAAERGAGQRLGLKNLSAVQNAVGLVARSATHEAAKRTSFAAFRHGVLKNRLVDVPEVLAPTGGMYVCFGGRPAPSESWRGAILVMRVTDASLQKQENSGVSRADRTVVGFFRDGLYAFRVKCGARLAAIGRQEWRFPTGWFARP